MLLEMEVMMDMTNDEQNPTNKKKNEKQKPTKKKKKKKIY